MTVNIIAIAILCIVIVIANLHQSKMIKSQNLLNFSLTSFALMILGLGIFIALLSIDNLIPTDATADVPDITTQSGFAFLIVSMLFGSISLALIYSKSIRLMFQRYVVQSIGKDKHYSASSPVHTTALVMMIFVSLLTIGLFILSGGIVGLAQEYAEVNFGIADLLTPFLGYILVSLLGVGIFLRRDIWQAIQRLGIHLPEQNGIATWLMRGTKHLFIGAVVGFGLFWVQVVLTLVWQLLTPPELLAEQLAATEALFAAFSGSLWLGFLLALTAGIGEELFFRGALQPIFGNVLVSIFFVLLHSQYLLTPASLIILLVSLVFGLLRAQYTTPTAMMAHFVYNFTPFVLIELLTRMDIPLETF